MNFEVQRHDHFRKLNISRLFNFDHYRNIISKFPIKTCNCYSALVHRLGFVAGREVGSHHL